MVPTFERFDRRRMPAQSQPHVTIQKRGTLSLNRAAFLALGSPESVALLYDRDNAVIGLRTTDAKDPEGAHVRTSRDPDTGPWLVSAMAFIKHYGIDASETRRWPATLDGDILCVELAGPRDESAS